ncbi:MlaD family protein [Nocardia sp. NPDC006630]|uniref:MlaD family protein n=1 Tax=Nocardia sp. NPDC006630 TaxID=3157181 RepID=UPI0033AC1197
MLRRILLTRGFVTVLGGLLVAVMVTAGAFVLLDPMKKTVGYCAIMPDSIGLYDGNAVTIRGMKVGTVHGIRPDVAGVRVDFDIDAAHPPQGTVRATTVSDTLLADRTLAVVGDTGGPVWNPGTCITQTSTPKSLTQTFTALSKVADELQGGDDPVKRDQVQHAVAAFDQATAGSGPKLNGLIRDLASAVRSPDAAIGHIGSLIDTVDELSMSVAGGWGKLREMLNGFAPILQTVNDVWDQVVEMVNSIVTLLPLLNDITTKYGKPILRALDGSVPLLHLIGANVGSLSQLIDMIPVVNGLFQKVSDPDTGRLSVAYAPPKVALAQPDADQVCQALNVLAPGGCAGTGGGTASASLVPMLLAMAGVR